MAFKKATKALARAKIALTGPSGSGKTYSALRLAKGIGGKWAVIDTENNSASLYCDRFHGWTYDVDAISPPYTAKKFFESIDEAMRLGYDGIILDSASHMWAGDGGLLQQKEALDSRGGNSYTNWGSITKIHEHFKSLIVNAPIHMIVTMRSKQEYIMEQNEKGKSAPKKIGLAPIQRDGLEYEFTVVFDIGMDHQFMVSKDRTALFDGEVSTLTEETGERIKAWLSTDVPVELVVEPKDPATAQIKPEPQKPVETEPRAFKEARENREKVERQVMNHATNELVDPPPSYAPSSHDSIAAYTVPFGKKHFGKTLEEMGIKEAKSYAAWLSDNAKKSGKALDGAALSFTLNVHEFERRMLGPKEDAVPMPDTHGEIGPIPF